MEDFNKYKCYFLRFLKEYDLYEKFIRKLKKFNGKSILFFDVIPMHNWVYGFITLLGSNYADRRYYYKYDLLWKEFCSVLDEKYKKSFIDCINTDSIYDKLDLDTKLRFYKYRKNINNG